MTMFAQEYQSVNTGAVAAASRFHHYNSHYQISLRHVPQESSEGNKLNNSNGPYARQVRVPDTRTIPAYELTQGDWLKISADAMKRHVQGFESEAKRLADILKCSPRTAENYLQARTAPSGLHLLRALASIPEFEAEVRRISAMETNSDPHLERAMSALVNAYQRRKGE